VPSLHDGRECRDVRLRFDAGVVVEASASFGEDALLARLDTDEGARRVGEFAIGTNEMIQRAVGDTLFDEKIGGTCHLALGRSFPLLGGDNASAIHWDLVCDLRSGGRIDADGEPLLIDGKLTV
jgi:aminopeptidase